MPTHGVKVSYPILVVGKCLVISVDSFDPLFFSMANILRKLESFEQEIKEMMSNFQSQLLPCLVGDLLLNSTLSAFSSKVKYTFFELFELKK